MRRVKESEEIQRIRAERRKLNSETFRNICIAIGTIGTMLKLWL